MSKSLQSFREWAVAQGQVSNPTDNPKNQYRGECVSLIQQYLNQVFGVAFAPRGHARDFVPPSFTRIDKSLPRKAGDIIRYNSAYGGGYGHIGIIDDGGKFLDQNGVVSRRVGRRDTPFNYIDAVFRPNASFTIDNPTPAPTPNSGFLGARGYLRRGDVGENIRSLNAFLRKTFPMYAPASVLGNQFGPITERTIKEFQRRAKVGGGIDGRVGPLTYQALKNYGFKG